MSVSIAQMIASPLIAVSSSRGAPASLSATGRHVLPSGTISSAAAWRFFSRSSSVSGGAGGFVTLVFAWFGAFLPPPPPQAKNATGTRRRSIIAG